MRFVYTNVLLCAISKAPEEAARALGCDTVLSEDLGPDQDFAGVRVENPFA